MAPQELDHNPQNLMNNFYSNSRFQGQYNNMGNLPGQPYQDAGQMPQASHPQVPFYHNGAYPVDGNYGGGYGQTVVNVAPVNNSLNPYNGGNNRSSRGGGGRREGRGGGYYGNQYHMQNPGGRGGYNHYNQGGYSQANAYALSQDGNFPPPPGQYRKQMPGESVHDAMPPQAGGPPNNGQEKVFNPTAGPVLAQIAAGLAGGVTPKQLFSADASDQSQSPMSGAYDGQMPGGGIGNIPQPFSQAQMAEDDATRKRAIASSGSFVYMVHFKRSHQYCLVDPQAQNINIFAGSYVIVEADRGIDIGIVGDLVPAERFWAIRFAAISKKTLKNIVRLATKEEVFSLISKTSDEIVVTQICQELLLTTHPLPIDILDAEYQYDRNKLTIHHDSSKRCDFRSYVRDLFCIFKTRIWMQQIDRKHENHQMSTNTTPEAFERMSLAGRFAGDQQISAAESDPVKMMLQLQTLPSMHQPKPNSMTTDSVFYAQQNQHQQMSNGDLPQMMQMQSNLNHSVQQMSELQVQATLNQVDNDMQDLGISDRSTNVTGRRPSPPLQNLSGVGMNANGNLVIDNYEDLSNSDGTPQLMTIPIGAHSNPNAASTLSTNFDGNIADLTLSSELSTLAAERESIFRDQHMKDKRVTEIQMEEARLNALKHVLAVEQHLQEQE